MMHLLQRPPDTVTSLPPAPAGTRRRRLDPAALIARYQAGATLAEVGRQFGCSAVWVLYCLKQAGVPRRPSGRQPVDHVTRLAAYRARAGLDTMARPGSGSVAASAIRVGSVSSARRGRDWSPAEWAAVVTAYQAGAALAAIGAQHGVSRQAIQQLLKRTGIPARPAIRRRRAEHAAIIAAYQGGATLAEAGQLTGITPPSVAVLLHRHGIALRRRQPAADDPALVSAISAAYQQGATGPQLARQCGLSHCTVYALLQRAGIPRRPRGTPSTTSA